MTFPVSSSFSFDMKPYWKFYQWILAGKNTGVFSENTDVSHLQNQSMVAISVMKMWPWKLGQGHLNLISYWSCPIYIGLQIWQHSIQWSMRYMQTNTFLFKFGGLSLAVTVKIRSRPPKPIQLFIMSKCYIHANLVKICQLVHEILGTQAPFGLNLAV